MYRVLQVLIVIVTLLISTGCGNHQSVQIEGYIIDTTPERIIVATQYVAGNEEQTILALTRPNKNKTPDHAINREDLLVGHKVKVDVASNILNEQSSPSIAFQVEVLNFKQAEEIQAIQQVIELEKNLAFTFTDIKEEQGIYSITIEYLTEQPMQRKTYQVDSNTGQVLH